MNGMDEIAVKGKDFGSAEMNSYSLFSIYHQRFIVLKFMNFSISSEEMRAMKKRKKGTERGQQSSLLKRFIEAAVDLTAFLGMRENIFQHIFNLFAFFALQL
jgi:hypothetical protein